ncbi:hypothetical protein BDF20DRAFT_907173 [Mycotypha africana]|uniref:uncharacterized protein n=1 Tax=Mycotypha africana TaxID=64632 RepID=UPI002301BFCA|nr:uncharacterized protein BDF20DRAFT_907173 [Mycotypha africana]KAI8973752.1 hypothetical protein BDF20DRAFT_907173 [Mycotypha africana]
MVRGEDSYLNATQILKVAGFEKTRRSKILEREVLTGEHEKVQGGYGKYQGTWIPFERGKQLAEKYKVLDSLMPLLNFDPSTVEKKNILTKEEAKLQARIEEEEQQNSQQSASSETHHASSSAVLALSAPPSSSAITDSNDRSGTESSKLISQKRPYYHNINKSIQQRKRLKAVSGVSPEPISAEDPFYEDHRNLLMSVFLPDDHEEEAPSLLSTAILTKDINIDLVIDEQGHTALHWAAALGRVRIVDLLIKNGANVCRVNYEGETPLMRAAMIACCYERKCFSEMVELLSESITITDKKGRTVLHHIVQTAAVEGYVDAAVYYMKRFVKALRPKKMILRNIINVKDTHRQESALAIALRLECQDIVDILIKTGALDPLIPNIDEYENMQFTPEEYKPNEKAQEIIRSMQSMMEKLEEDYNEKLRKKDADNFEMRKELDKLRYELKEAQRRLQLPASIQLAEARRRIHEIESNMSLQNSNSDTNNTSSQEPELVPVKEVEMTLTEIPPSSTPMLDSGSSSSVSREDVLEKEVKALHCQLETSHEHIERLQAELEAEKRRANEKEMEYRRLIAISCGLPIEKVDPFVKPLTVAIESDPPPNAEKMTRIIKFMENLKPTTLIENGAITSTTDTIIHHTSSPQHPTASPMSLASHHSASPI